jgi:hypothetical protein
MDTYTRRPARQHGTRLGRSGTAQAPGADDKQRTWVALRQPLQRWRRGYGADDADVAQCRPAGQQVVEAGTQCPSCEWQSGWAP